MKKILTLLSTLLVYATAQSNPANPTKTGNQANPEKIIFSFQKQKNPMELKKTSEDVAKELSTTLKKQVDVVVPSSYGTTAQGLISGTVHVAYMDSLPFILASREADLEIIAVEKRQGKTDYDSLILVRKDSPIKNLNDLKGKRIAFSSQTSTSGFLFPFYRLLKDKNIRASSDLNSYFSQIVYAGGYDKALAALAAGQVDAAAMSDYAFEGAKADLYGTQAQRDQLRVLTRTPGVPTHLVAISKRLSPELRSQIQQSLFGLIKSKPDLIASVYGAAELVAPSTSQSHVKATEDALKFTDLTPGHFVK